MCTTILVMSEEFEQLPDMLKRMSSLLVHNRRTRTAFICGVIVVMTLTSSISFFSFVARETSQKKMSIEAYSPSQAQRFSQPKQEAYLHKTQKIIVNLSLKTTLLQNISINYRWPTSSNCTDDCYEEHDVLPDSEATALLADRRTILRKMNSNLSYYEYKAENQARNYDNDFGREKRSSLNRVYYKDLKQRNQSAGNTTDDRNKGNSSFMSNCCMRTIDCLPIQEYVVYSWVLCLVALATALKLYYLVKLCLAVIIIGTTIALISNSHVTWQSTFEYKNDSSCLDDSVCK